jgi:hypothetical protein
LNAQERKRAVEILSDYLKDASKIVKTFAMQALADIAAEDTELRGPILERLKRLTRIGSPAMKSRGRKLLAQLEQAQERPGRRVPRKRKSAPPARGARRIEGR